MKTRNCISTAISKGRVCQAHTDCASVGSKLASCLEICRAFVKMVAQNIIVAVANRLSPWLHQKLPKGALMPIKLAVGWHLAD